MNDLLSLAARLSFSRLTGSGVSESESSSSTSEATAAMASSSSAIAAAAVELSATDSEATSSVSAAGEAAALSSSPLASIDSRNLLGLNVLAFAGVPGVADLDTSERGRAADAGAFTAYGPRSASSQERHRL